MPNLIEYEATIGLEVHAQLSTNSKTFCGCSTKFGMPPNSNVCPICLGHPGVLPVLNKKVVEYAVKMGLATNCTINEKSIFARKNYFYPDLPKGWQTSQFELPICEHGFITVFDDDGNEKKIEIKRIHMEEDAGKSIHDQGFNTSIDLNRCGVPLIEIVTEPNIKSSKEAYQYLTKIKQLVTYLEICDGNMEEGSLRCDANISIAPKGSTQLGTRTEVKNLNSFRNVERAIDFEIERQKEIITNSGEVIQETLLWNADLNEAASMRGKEEAHDYRYFPEPDLMPVVISDEWETELKNSLPILPEERKSILINKYNLPEYDAEVLSNTKQIADYYDGVIKVTDDYKSASNWVMGDILAHIKNEKISITELNLEPENLGKLILLINKKTISGKIAKDILPEMLELNKDPEVIIKEKNLVQISDTGEIEKIVKQIIDQNPKQVEQFLAGKDKVIGFFVGQVMKESRGKANPQSVNEILLKLLNDLK